MNMNDNDKNAFRDFIKFLNAKPIAPNRKVDDAILKMVEKDLRLPVWRAYAKMLFISVSTGLISLMVCPQFGIGQETHLFQGVHAIGSNITLYLFCGLFFVTFGASVSAAVLERSEIQAISQLKYAFFLAYSFVSFTLLISLGRDAFVITSLFWVLGAIFGNILGFEAVVKLRQVSE